MNTLEKTKPSEMIAESAARLVGALVIGKLKKSDQNCVFELTKDILGSQSEEDTSEAIRTICEILFSCERGGRRLDQEGAAGSRTETTNRWIHWVSRKVRELRKNAKLTQAELALKSGLPQSHISRIENGQLSPSHVTLEKIASALDIDVSKLTLLG